MTATLDVDLVPLLDALSAALVIEDDPVRQQQAIELLTVRHAVRMGSRDSALFVAKHMHRHIQQMLGQYFDERAKYAAHTR